MTEEDSCPDVRLVYLLDELSATAARGEHCQTPIRVPPHSDGAGYCVLAAGNHRCDRSVLGAEAGPGTGVDAHACVDRTGNGLERSSDVAEQAIAHTMRVELGASDLDEIRLLCPSRTAARNRAESHEP